MGSATVLTNGVNKTFDISDFNFKKTPKVTPITSTWCTVYSCEVTSTSVKIGVCPFLANVSMNVKLRFESQD